MGYFSSVSVVITVHNVLTKFGFWLSIDVACTHYGLSTKINQHCFSNKIWYCMLVTLKNEYWNFSLNIILNIINCGNSVYLKIRLTWLFANGPVTDTLLTSSAQQTLFNEWHKCPFFLQNEILYRLLKSNLLKFFSLLLI